MAVQPLDVEAVFNEARAKDPKDRAAYLDAACGDDAALRQRVEQLIEAQAEIGSFLEAPAAGRPSPTIDQPVTERPGTVIGPYKLLQQIGEGGMGVVWMAEQTQPVQRKVALKVIKPGMALSHRRESRPQHEAPQRGEANDVCRLRRRHRPHSGSGLA